MEFLVIILIAGVVFLLCWLVDKGFSRLFRNQAQHKSGLAVRLGKGYATGGILLLVLGLMALLTGVPDNTVLWVGGLVILVTGIGLIVYYLSYGIFYDEDSFVLNTFGKKGKTYQFNQIKSQQLYVVTGGNMLVELHMTDGSAVQVYSQMTGMKEFLEHAHMRWCHQKGIDHRDCEFYDPDNYSWFPGEEET